MNNLPTANDQSVTTEVNTPVNIALTGSDPDKNDNLTAHTISQPSNGRLGKIDQTTGIVTYTPRTGFNGNDRFAFKVNDGKVDSNQAGNITITIKKLETLGTSNQPPTANDQSVTTEEDKPVNITLTGSDPDKNDNLTAHTLSKPSNGRLGEIDQTTGIVTYTPGTGFVGKDKFTFNTNDGKVNSSNSGTIAITVNRG